ncbi:amidase domain-containing protein [Paenarthrobacter sp. NPDC089322]|uniref:amidase domain-containing protein n=1 Tax=Paenarthrobacter sp. NPDC089322 TaxID=3155065 RepID=UPI00343BF816
MAHATRAPLSIGPGLKASPANPAPREGYVGDAKPENKTDGQVSTFGAGYNYGAMTSYATSWAYGRNSAYRQFGNDCQNFVSQSLRAGGWADQYSDLLSMVSWSQGHPRELPHE